MLPTPTAVLIASGSRSTHYIDTRVQRNRLGVVVIIAGSLDVFFGVSSCWEHRYLERRFSVRVHDEPNHI